MRRTSNNTKTLYIILIVSSLLSYTLSSKSESTIMKILDTIESSTISAYEKTTPHQNLEFLESSNKSSQVSTSISNQHPSYFTFTPSENDIKAKCFYINKSTLDVWELYSLSSTDSHFLIDKYKNTMFYNFCKNTSTQCRNTNSLSYIQFNTTNQCEVSTGSADEMNYWRMINENDYSKGIILNMNEGDSCGEGKRLVRWVLECDETKDKLDVYNQSELDFTKCEIEIKAKTKAACAITNYYYISKFCTENKYLIVIAFSVVGLLLAFIGMKFFWVSLAIMISIVIITIVMWLYLLIASLVGYYGNLIGMIIILVLGFAVGIGLTFLLKSFIRLVFIVIGGYYGYIIGYFLYNFLSLNRIQSNPEVIYYCTLGCCMIVGAVIGYFFMKVLFILATSTVGSYLFVRGVSFIFGGFPSESIVMDLIKKQEWNELNKMLSFVIYAYLCSWLLLSCGSAYVQMRWNKDISDEDLSYKEHKNE